MMVGLSGVLVARNYFWSDQAENDLCVGAFISEIGHLIYLFLFTLLTSVDTCHLSWKTRVLCPGRGVRSTFVIIMITTSI